MVMFLKLLIDNMKNLYLISKINFTKKKFPLAIKISKADERQRFDVPLTKCSFTSYYIEQLI